MEIRGYHTELELGEFPPRRLRCTSAHFPNHAVKKESPPCCLPACRSALLLNERNGGVQRGGRGHGLFYGNGNGLEKVPIKKAKGDENETVSRLPFFVF